MEFIYFSFLQGVVAFFAPCAVALLPGYIVSYISRSDKGQLAMTTKLRRGLKLAFLSILGILLIYSIAGIFIVVASQLLKAYMKWVTIGMGGVLMVLGGLMVAGKNITFSINVNQNRKSSSEAWEAFVFGIAYAIGALGCLFPLFLVVATQALAAPSLLLGGSYIFAYFLGISLMMISAILLSTFARDLFMKYLRKILPHMDLITGLLLIIAGGYVIYYQMVLI